MQNTQYFEIIKNASNRALKIRKMLMYFCLFLVSFIPFNALAEIKIGPKVTYFSGNAVGENDVDYSGYGTGPRFMALGDTALMGIDIFRTHSVLKGRENIGDIAFGGTEIGPFVGIHQKSWFFWIGKDIYDEITSNDTVKLRDGTKLGDLKFNGNSKRIGLGFIAFDFLTINIELKNHKYSLTEASGGDIPKAAIPNMDIETNVFHFFTGFYFR